MLKRKAIVIVTATLAGLALVSLVIAQKPAKLMKRQQLSLNQLQQQEKEKESQDATPIQEGVMTKKERKHSKLFEIPGGKRLKDRVANDGDVRTEQEVPFMITPRYATIQDYLQSLACKTDAVIIGTVKSKASQLTEQGTYIFTDYEITVTDVLKNNASSPIQTNADITVVRAGGAVKLKDNGRLLRVDSETERPLKVGDRYILFLKFIPDTGAYSAVGHTGENSFEIDGDKVKQVSHGNLPLGAHSSVDAITLINEIQTALNLDCNSQKETRK
jgi:hypothetical protein